MTEQRDAGEGEIWTEEGKATSNCYRKWLSFSTISQEISSTLGCISGEHFMCLRERERERENVCLYVCALFGKRGGEGVRQKEKEKDGEPG